VILTTKENAVDAFLLGIEVCELCNVIRNHAAQGHGKVCRLVVIQVFVLCTARAVWDDYIRVSISQSRALVHETSPGCMGSIPMGSSTAASNLMW
jgi:hypothetical protein